MVATLPNHSGILNRATGLNAAKPWRTQFNQCSKAPSHIVLDVQKGTAGAPTDWVSGQCRADLPLASDASDAIRRTQILLSPTQPRLVLTEFPVCQERFLLSFRCAKSGSY